MNTIKKYERIHTLNIIEGVNVIARVKTFVLLNLLVLSKLFWGEFNLSARAAQ